VRIGLLNLLLGVAVAGPSGWRHDGSGTWPVSQPPTVWASNQPVLWSTPLPVWSNASPAVGGGKVCVCVEPTTLTCLDAATGRVLWSAPHPVADAVPAAERDAVLAREARITTLEAELASVREAYGRLLREARASGSPDAAAKAEVQARRADEIKSALARETDTRTPPDQDMVGWSSPTPVTDGKRVFALFANGVIAAHDLADGKRLWARWQGTAPVPMLGWEDGHASSPVLAGGVLVVPFRTLTGLDAATGKVLWEAGPWRHYGTPAVVDLGGVAVVLTPDGRALRASDGAVLRESLADQWYVGPVVSGRTVYYLDARSEALMKRNGGTELHAWRLDGVSGSTLSATKLWTTKLPGTDDAFYAAPAVGGSYVYALTHEARLIVVEASSGRILGEQVIDGIRPTSIWASPSVAGGRLYVTDEKGVTVVLSASGKPVVEATNRGWPTRASLAFEGTRVFVRHRDGVVAVGR
jgi:outer membrane protein assembly factor BamB